MRVLAAFVLALIAAALLFVLSAPGQLDPAIASEIDKPGDAKAGEIVFHAAGCAACHAQGEDESRLGGGLELKTAFGAFYAPNISSDPDDGIGRWTAREFGQALYDGVDSRGEHLYPAFPYASYRHMAVADARDLFAYLKTLPAVKGRAPLPALHFPFNVRRLIGLWKRIYLSPVAPPETMTASASADYGRYLVQGAGHCGECHTPRDPLGGPKASQALTGAPALAGKGKAPNITPAGLKSWSEEDVETALATGVTPDGDSLGGAMGEVVRNLGRLPKDYVKAIATYLKGGA